jgi:hypothetical protein
MKSSLLGAVLRLLIDVVGWRCMCQRVREGFNMLESYLYGLVAKLPLIAIALVFCIVGWRRLRVHHREAATWLTAGMATVVAYGAVSAFTVAYTARLQVQIRERGGQITEALPTMTAFGLVLSLLVLVALACLGMAAISGRRDPSPAVAPSNNSL